MAYFIRRLREREDTVMFWRGPQDPFAWAYHPSDAAKFPTIDEARTAYRKATGNFPYRQVTVVGGQ